jgi:hypothetical protein
MPMDKKRYPPNWDEISRQIRFERAGNRCEACDVKNGAVGARDRHGNWHDEDSIHSLNAGVGDDLFGDFPNMIKIVLTVHHIGMPKPDGSPGSPDDKMDCRDENLICLCQGCHLNADRPHHLRKRREKRLRRQHEQMQRDGNLPLFEV